MFGNKFKKLKREDVVDAICELSKQQSDLEKGVIEKGALVDDLMQKGKVEKNRDLKLFYAKKISHLNEEKKRDIKRGMYLLYNMRLLERLKTAIDDNNFIVNNSKIPLNKLLADQKGLANFLNQTLNNKTKAEELMTGADDMFTQVEGAYQENSTIYGVGDNEDELLAMFENDAQLDLENEMALFDDDFNQVPVKKAQRNEE